MIRALLAGAACAVLPGFFWAVFLRPACGLGERLAYSTVISMGVVPLVAIVIARAAGIGITLWVAIVSAVIVFGSGVALYAWKGSAAKPITGLLPRPGPIRDFRVMTLVAAVMALTLITTLRLHGTALLVVTPSTPRLLIVLTVAGLVVAGIVVAWPRPGSPLPGTPAPPGGPGTPARTDEPDTPAAPPAAAPPAAARQPDSDTQPASGGPVIRTARVMSRATVQPRAAASAPPRAWWAATGGPAWVREGALAVVLVLTGYRAYARVVNYEWPFIQGGDQFNHAVMTEQMLIHGSYPSYLVYPPGFSALTAVLSRFADLSPVKIFPVLAPALVVLCSLGAYAVAARLWDWRYGIVATAVNGLVLTSAYNGLADGRYPDLVSAFFLLVMTVAALLLFYEVPSFRSGVIVTIAGSSVVLYHTVATLYLVLLLAAVAVIGLPYLALTGQRRLARRLLLALTAVAAVSAIYAAYIYLGAHGSSSATVAQDLGSQAAYNAWHVLAEVSPPVIWLGLFGAVLLLVGLRHVKRPEQVLGVATMLIWCGLMYVGSRTAIDGFPERFERDLGAPLSITAALGVGVCVHTIVAYFNARTRKQVMIEVGAYAAVALAAVTALVQVVSNVDTTGRPRTQIINRPLATAGAWLNRHNTGGNIISTPSLPGGSRTMLALGGYTELQSFSAYRTADPRSLPTAGRQQLLDSHYVLLHPTECRSAQIIARDDVRYVVLLTSGAGAHLPGFAAEPQRYRPVYQNVSVVIYQPLRTSCPR